MVQHATPLDTPKERIGHAGLDTGLRHEGMLGGNAGKRTCCLDSGLRPEGMHGRNAEKRTYRPDSGPRHEGMHGHSTVACFLPDPFPCLHQSIGLNNSTRTFITPGHPPAAHAHLYPCLQAGPLQHRSSRDRQEESGWRS
eukprot:scaffold154338_cov15-Tisochrysis_lutea.AAC.1